MKTSERILLTALTLFNKHGENSVTSVDIALALDISPGNLYYHFKGKESIVVALMRMHKQQMQRVLVAEKLDELNADEVMYYLYLLIDSLHVFRFFYRSPADLVEKYADIARPRKHILQALQTHLAELLGRLKRRGLLSASTTDQTMLVELLCLIMSQSCQYDELNRHLDETTQRYHALSLIMVSLLPRLVISQSQSEAIRNAIESHAFANMSNSLSQDIFNQKE